MTPDVSRLAMKARGDLKMRCNALMGMVHRAEGLRASFERLAQNKAPGVDGVKKENYAIGLDDKLGTLSARLSSGAYRPKPARRVYIPKANGGRRPLGIPSFEDRIVQDRLSQILQAIWEPEFRGCSYGFRPHRSAHDALRCVARVLTHERAQFVVEADIKGFFNEMNHQHLLRFLAHRIADRRFLRVIQRFLKAGVIQDGAFAPTETGTLQGGLVSPVLANIYLHYTLDWWFEGRFAKTCAGTAQLIRYADDFVVCFEKQADAERFMKVLPQRLAAFGLELEPKKTGMLRFGRFAQADCYRDGLARPKTFNFLGFTHFVTTSRVNGRFMVGRKTERQRLCSKLKELNTRVRQLRIQGGAAMVQHVQRHLRGHIQYYAVSGNLRSMGVYARHCGRILFKWLNRRSQRPSITWERFSRLLADGLLPKVRLIHHLYPKPSFLA
ncbi:MAG: group II intron reverse transcriptase/maturase [Cytophagaceae bacterium]|nr:MAG: group II intron reverse transcriptase/maturase [Cytophagaceae bacterium]